MARLRWLIIPVFGILLMSHNASAINTTFYLKNGIYAYGIPAQSGGQGGTNSNITSGATYNYLNNIYSLPGDRIWYSINFYFNSDHSRIDVSEFTDFTFSFSYCADNATNFIPSSNDYYLITDYYEFESDFNQLMIDNGTGYNIEFTGKCRNVLLRGKVLTTNASGFQLGTTNNQSFTRIFGNSGNNNSLTPYLFILSPTVVFYTETNEADEALEKERQETQEQSEAGDSAADSSTDDVSNATQSLASAMGSIISVIKDTPASDCNISISTTGSSAGFTSAIGALNLCSGVPSNILNTIRGLAALVIVPYVLYAAYSICIKMYRTFTEVQNT